MRKGQKTAIAVDGKLYSATYLGKGKYSRVFRVGNRAVMYTRDDCGKEVMALFQHTRMMHISELVRHEDILTEKSRWQVYSSPFYRDVTKKDHSAYELAKRIIFFYVDHYGRERVKGIYAMQAFVNKMEEAVTINNKGLEVSIFPRSVIRAMQELVDIASNCGEQVGFDIHLKNFGVNEYGVLIFRDLINPLTHEYR